MEDSAEAAFTKILSIVVFQSPESSRAVFAAAASACRSTWSDPSLWRLLGKAYLGSRGRLPLCAAAVAYDEDRVAFLIDSCGVNAGNHDLEGVSPLVALSFKTRFNRESQRASGDDSRRRRIETRLLVGGGFRALPWLTTQEKNNVMACYEAGDKDALHLAYSGGFMLATHVKTGGSLFQFMRLMTQGSGVPEAENMERLRRMWAPISPDADPDIVHANPHADAATELGAASDEDEDGGFVEEEDDLTPHWNVFEEGRLLLSPAQLAAVEALGKGCNARMRRNEWRLSTASRDDDGCLLPATETYPPWGGERVREGGPSPRRVWIRVHGRP